MAPHRRNGGGRHQAIEIDYAQAPPPRPQGQHRNGNHRHHNSAPNQTRSSRRGQQSSRRQSRIRRESESEVGCCMKYSLFGFNVLFWLLGGLILFIGLYAFIEKRGLIQDLENVSNVHFDPSFALIILGFVVFVVAFFGCIGSLRENNCFLCMFASILLVVVLAEITSGVLAYCYRDWVKDNMNKLILQNIKEYREDPDLQDIIDGIQSELECCGGQSADDWDNNMYFNCTGTDRDKLIPEACGVPFSCCKRHDQSAVINTQCGFGARNEQNFNIHGQGCVKKIETWIKENIVPIAGVVLFILLVQIFGVFISFTLKSDINRQRSKWLSSERYAPR